MSKDRVAFITTIYRNEELPNVRRIKKEISRLGFKDYRFYLYDGRGKNRGYAYGINQGIKKALKEGCEVFVIFTVDIAFREVNRTVLYNGLKYFDLLGFAMKQGNKIYFGGDVDKLRLSGALTSTKPENKYLPVDFVSGSLMIIKRKVVKKVGLLNEGYFMYYEDVEYAKLAKQFGFKVGIDSEHSYEHFEKGRSNPHKDQQIFVSRFKYFLKFSSLPQKLRETVRLPLTAYEHLPLFVSQIKQSSFTVNFFSLNLSSILTKIAHFFIFIILINNLNPSQYGIYTLVWAFVNLFTPFLDSGTTTYGLVYGKNKSETNQVLFSMRFYLSLLVYLVIVGGSFAYFQNSRLRIFVALTATSVFTTSLSGSYLIFNSLREKVYVSSLLNLGFNFFFAVLVVLAILAKQGIVYLFASYAVSYLCYSVLNMFWLRRELNYAIYFRKWISIFRRSLVFVFIGFLAALYFKADIFILKRFYNSETLGIYSAGLKFLDALLILIGSYNIIVIPIMRRLAKNKHELVAKIKKDIVFLLGFGGLISGSFYILAPFVLPLFLKNRYLESLEVAKVLSLAIIPLFVTSVAFNALYSLKSERNVLVLLVIQTVVSLTVYWLVIPNYSYQGAMFAKVGLEIFQAIIAFFMLILVLQTQSHAPTKNP